MIKRYFGVIEVVLGLALLVGGSGAFRHIKQSNKLEKTTELNKEQADKIDNLVKELQVSNANKDMISKSLQDTENKLKERAKMGFSVLYDQAVDIHEENETPFTTAHLETAKGYVQVWGYDSMAKIIRWQMETIKKQQQNTAQLLLKQKELELTLANARADFEHNLGQAKLETETHKMTANNLQGQVSKFLDDNSILNDMIFWLAVGTGLYVFISIGGFSLLGMAKSKAHSQLREVKSAIKSFTDVNEDGNETMKAIINAHKIDLDK